MKLSRYDRNHNGICDVKACKNVLTLIDQSDPYPAQAALIARDLQPLGISLHIVAPMGGTFLYLYCDPTERVPLCPSFAWGKDYADAITMAVPLFSSRSIVSTGGCRRGPPFFRASGTCQDFALVGASATWLRRYSYKTTRVPSVDPQLQRCERLTGQLRIQCWTGLDRYLMEKVVPVVPYLFDNTVNVLGRRVGCYSFDQFAAAVALDHLCITK